MRVTIAICTWNRADLLGQTLEQMTRLRVPLDVELEVLVVNNNSTDSTDEVIESFSLRLPVRRVFEPKPGLSAARNHATRVAKGEYIIWTDDDVLVDEGWLQAYHEAFLRWPDAAIFGGPVEPLFGAPPPDWLVGTLDRFAMSFALRDVDPEPMPIAASKTPFGANVAFRTRSVADFPFDPALGVSAARGQSSIGGEETVVILGMLAAGFKGWWVPRARVRHYIPPDRMTTAYFRRKSISWGRYVSRKRIAEGRRIAARSLLRRAVRAELRYRFHRRLSEPERWTRDLLESGQCWGELFETLALGRWRIPA
jgi:glycosyltransferase involved in cell wall biosynthesis